VVVAENGRAAVEAIDRERFDLVLMDVQMPEMDGLQATRLLREREIGLSSHQAVVAMTALVMQGDRERCITAGMDGYLTKPIRPQELDALLDTYMAVAREPALLEDPVGLPQLSVNTRELLDRVDSDLSFLSELLELLRGDYPSQIEEIREAVEKGDNATLQEVSHALKGALGNLAAPIASGIAGELESIGRSGDIAHAGARLAALEEEMGRVMEQLEGLCMVTAQ
jgi:CheY-like chemotaxis protein